MLGQIAKAGERRGARRFSRNESPSIQLLSKVTGGPRVSLLIQIALLQSVGYAGKYIVRVSADQTERADDYDENHGKHHSVFGNVLPFIAQPNVS